MADFERITGVMPVRGGAHPNLGTHNALVALGGDVELTETRPAAPADDVDAETPR